MKRELTTDARFTFSAEELQTEEWRAVVGYEGLYEVSNLGRVRKTGGVRLGSPDGILVTTHDPRNTRYPQVWLRKGASQNLEKVGSVLI